MKLLDTSVAIDHLRGVQVASALPRRLIAPVGPSRRQPAIKRRPAPMGTSPGHQPIHAEVFVQVRPTNVLAGRVQLPAVPLIRCCMHKPWCQTSGTDIHRLSASSAVNWSLLIVMLVAPKILGNIPYEV